MLLFALVISFFVQTQKDFDTLQERIDSAYEAGRKGIDIQLDSSVFYFRDHHLSFMERSMPGFSIRFTGRGSVIVAESGDSLYNVDKGYINLDTLTDIDTANEVKKAHFWPFKVPFKKDVWCIPVNEPDMSEEEARDVSIVLSQWFQGKIYKVLKITNGWMYFRRDDKTGTGIYSELRFGRCLPRYILCHPPAGQGYHCCSATNFLTVHESQIGEISFHGIRFLGNAYQGNPDYDILLRFRSSTLDSVVVADCVFEGLRSEAIRLVETDNLIYRNNVMSGCYRSGINCDVNSDNCRVTGSTFVGNGRMMVHNFNVCLQGENILIQDNLFEDFSYIAIGVGSHYTSDFCRTEGYVRHNELRMSDDFRRGVPRMLIDGGAIYCWTQNKDIVIDDNYIHDISGPHGNRGILADDGAVNVTISRNRVENVTNAYSIDIRRARWISRRARSNIWKVNIGNKIFDNVYTGKVRIYIDPSDPASFSYNNQKIDQEV